jgi:uncharacterized protein YbjT (DUF2867 family)
VTSLILVTGGTGTLGRQVAARLRDAGSKVRVLSRRSYPPGDGVEFVAGDLLTGERVGPAVDGAGVIVHCASSNKGDAEATRNLVRAAPHNRAGVDTGYQCDPRRRPAGLRAGHRPRAHRRPADVGGVPGRPAA